MRSFVSSRRFLRKPTTSVWDSGETAPFNQPIGTGAAFPRGNTDSQQAEKAGIYVEAAQVYAERESARVEM